MKLIELNLENEPERRTKKLLMRGFFFNWYDIFSNEGSYRNENSDSLNSTAQEDDIMNESLFYIELNSIAFMQSASTTHFILFCIRGGNRRKDCMGYLEKDFLLKCPFYEI